ncbi:uncharacterized protein [Ptychodera flava]|uniref:uncharacterized protein n=1 Tax=Ptychodera flava TaxID=63121 RepID=UPI003969EFE5
MIDIKSEKCKSYLVRHLDGNNRTKSHDPDSWQDRGHTVTIIRGEIGPQDTHDFLFIDHMHIHRENWQWLHKRTELVWKQRERGEYSAGYIGFTDDGRVGGGSMQIGDGVEVEAVELQYLRPSYTMAVSRDAGAYVAGEHELTLKWDINSEQWKNATWDEEAMTFTYWQEQWGNIGDDVIWQTATVFNDNTNNIEWDVQPRGPSGTGAATSHIDRYGQFVFSLNDFYDPPDMDVDKNLFPYKMVFEFDELAQNILGGAMLCRERSLKGDVYALTGRPQNHFVAGTYKLHRPGHFGTILTTHRQKLVIDGKHVEKSGIYHNKLWWEDLSAAQCKMSDLPPRGFVEFSADGSIVTHSSFGVEGYRAPAILEAEPTLSIYDLINMNPYKETSEGVVDSIQQSSMEGFYKILQYYMPKEDLNNFIAPYPPDLGDIEDIAKDDAANEEWYSQLSVPYLVNALKSADNENVKYLNARRAQAVMKEFTGTSEVYAQQTEKLYSHEWQKRFPNMVKFIADQAKNTEHQRRYIIESSAAWIKDIEEGISETTVEEEREDLKRMTSIAENVRERGLQGQYWSYILFKYLSSPQYLSMLRMMMTQGNTSSQQLTQNIQRYSSLLSILDSSGFFMKEFVEVMQTFQLTSLLPSFIDVANDWEEISMFVPIVTNAFIEKYVNSTDPQMRDYARDMQEELAKNKMAEYLKVLYSVGATVGSSSWVNVSREFTRKAVDKFGKGAAIVGQFYAFCQCWYEYLPIIHWYGEFP